jgi:cation diffusion facilitator CzcD-associated flavoprotein CzcO
MASLTAAAANSMKGKNVAIIGAGVSGLSMLRSLKAKNINCIAFEKASNLGGVWRENYIGSA